MLNNFTLEILFNSLLQKNRSRPRKVDRHRLTGEFKPKGKLLMIRCYCIEYFKSDNLQIDFLKVSSRAVASFGGKKKSTSQALNQTILLTIFVSIVVLVDNCQKCCLKWEATHSTLGQQPHIIKKIMCFIKR